MEKVSKLEKDLLQRNLNHLKKAIADFDKVKAVIEQYRKNVALLDVYRFLRRTQAYRTSTEILVHSENLERELNNLESSLHEAEMILVQRAQHYEQESKTTS